MSVADRRPTVSVVVPVLNGERFLRESLESILTQTYPASEVIVMDDGSTDATPEIVASFGDRVQYVRQSAPRGIYANANDGIALCSGEAIGVFHADDVYLPELLEREASVLAAYPDVGAVFSSDLFIDETGREFGRLKLPSVVAGGRPLDHRTVLNAMLTYTNTFLRCPTALVRSSVYRELGLYRQARVGNSVDTEMWLRIARERPLVVLDEHLLRYRTGHGNSSGTYHRLRTEESRFFEVLDAELAAGGRGFATARALHAYEAHRAEDRVLRAVSQYILGDLASARALLRSTSVKTLMRGSETQRVRMSALTLTMRALVRLPRLKAVARAFDRRWHGGTATAASG